MTGGQIMNNSIPISDGQKVFIANGIFRAISQDLPEIIYEHNLPTTVGAGLFRWNFINRNLSDSLCADFEVCIPPRGAWRVLILRDKVSNMSFSIMSEKNFQRLQRHPGKTVHYLEALISENEVREPISSQLSLFQPQQRDLSVLSNLRNQLLSGFSGIVQEHVLILFDYTYVGVTSARAVLLTPRMEIAVSEDWTHYLKQQYIPNKFLSEVASDGEEMLVKLKPQFDSANLQIVDSAKKEMDGKID